jgi:hypothetical protein
MFEVNLGHQFSVPSARSVFLTNGNVLGSSPNVMLCPHDSTGIFLVDLGPTGVFFMNSDNSGFFDSLLLSPFNLASTLELTGGLLFSGPALPCPISIPGGFLMVGVDLLAVTGDFLINNIQLSKFRTAPCNLPSSALIRSMVGAGRPCLLHLFASRTLRSCLWSTVRLLQLVVGRVSLTEVRIPCSHHR